MELITIKILDNFVEAHMIKSKLASEEIDSFLFDDNIVGANPLYSLTVGGIKLKVNEGDVAKAKNILKDLETDNTLQCPKCGSKDIYMDFKSMKGTKGFLSAIVSIFLMVFPIYYKTVNKCKSCSHEFK